MLTACAANKPLITVERAQWGERTDDAAVLHIELEVTNPGRVPLELREMRYYVNLDGQRVHWGRRSTSQSIASGDALRLTIPAIVPAEHFATASAATTASMEASLVYTTPGRMTLVMRDLGLPPLRRDFAGEAPLAPLQ